MRTALEIIKANNNALEEYLKKHNNQPYRKESILSYSGFGSVPQIMKDPLNDDHWKESEKSIRAEVLRFHQTVKRAMGNKEEEYLKVISSIKSSTLTAYYTPEEIVSVINKNISNYFKQKQIKILDPSAGMGIFTKHFKGQIIQSIEKERITSALLKSINNENPYHKVYRGGFESFSEENKNKFDLVISNIPFGAYKVFDQEYFQDWKKNKESIRFKSCNRIHSYYFMKGMDLLNKNGILAYITSTSIADSKSHSELRKELMMESELISFVRLPNNIFEGTAVNTDILILKKRTNRLTEEISLSETERKFIQTGILKYNDGEKEISQYINSLLLDEKGVLNERTLGYSKIGYLHSKEQIVFTSKKSINEISEELDSIIKIDIQNLKTPSNLENNSGEDIQLNLFDNFIQKKDNSLLLNSEEIRKYNLQNGDQYYKDGRYGIIEGNKLLPDSLLKIDSREIDKRIHFLKIIDFYYELENIYKFDPNSNQKNKIRNEFNDEYDTFIKKYGFINSPENYSLLNLRTERGPAMALEVYDPQTKQYLKTDIFKKDLEYFQIEQEQEIEQADEKITEFLSIEDLTNKSLNLYGEINIEYISKNLNTDLDITIQQGIEKRIFFLDPKIGHLDPDKKYIATSRENTSYKIVPKDEFLSGPIRFKIKEYEKNSRYWKYLSEEESFNSIELLKKHDNEYVDIYKLDPQLGESWIPLEYYKQFIDELLEVDSKVHLSHFKSEFSVKSNSDSYKNNTEYAVPCKNGRKLRGTKMIEIALNGSYPKITYTVKRQGEKISYPDREAMINATNKINDIRAKWNQFVLKSSEISKHLERIYNNTQNVDVERRYDGSHLEFKNIQNFELRPHQKNGVWQMLIQNGGVVDHAVGAGKTLLMASLSMELQRLKVAKKVMIIAMKANTQDIYSDFIKAYPNAKILSPNENDFTSAKRRIFFKKMMDERWDAIIMTHDQFLRIPQSREMRKKIVQEELLNLQRDLDDLVSSNNSEVSKRQLSGLQKRILNNEAQLLQLSESIRKDPDMITFDKMNIDHLMVDESQVFKNLPYTTRFENVAGLGNPEGSQRAFNLLLAVRTIQERYQDDKGITFLSGTTISNSLVELYLIKKFLRPKELARRNMPNFDSWARTYAKLERDYELTVTNEIKAKDRFRYFMKVPELARFYRSFTNVVTEENLKVDKPSLDIRLTDIEPTIEQKAYMQELVAAVKNEDFSAFGYGPLTDSQKNAKMLMATNIATKISLDLRLIDRDHHQEDGSKINTICQNVFQEYKNSHDHKGTQFIFLDTSTPTSQNAEEFNMYDSIRKTLNQQYQIPLEEIKFIHEYETKKRRTELFKNVNEGNVRIVVGSTQKMGVGVNMQERCVAMHHADIPWNPKDFTQRNGRGGRQGNIIAKLYGNKVKTFVYATKSTLDAYKYFLMDLKARFINQIKNDNITFRSLDEGDMGENGEMSPAAFIARLSGQEELLEKSKIDKKITDLELKKQILQKEFNRCSGNIKRIENLLPKVKELGMIYQTDFEKAKDLFHIDQKKQLHYTIETPSGNKISEPEKVKEFFSKEINQFVFDRKKEGRICKVGNFSILIKESFIENQLEEKTEKVHIMEIKSEETNHSYKYGTGIINFSIPGKQFRMPYDSLEGLENKAQKQEKETRNLSDEIEKEKGLLASINVSKYDREIQELKEKSAELQRIIEKNNDDKLPPEEENKNTPQGPDKTPPKIPEGKGISITI